MKRHEEVVTNKLTKAFDSRLTAEQILAVIAFAKLVRYRARNNNALFSLCTRVFSKFGALVGKKLVMPEGRNAYEAITIALNEEGNKDCMVETPDD